MNAEHNILLGRMQLQFTHKEYLESYHRDLFSLFDASYVIISCFFAEFMVILIQEIGDPFCERHCRWGSMIIRRNTSGKARNCLVS